MPHNLSTLSFSDMVQNVLKEASDEQASVKTASVPMQKVASNTQAVPEESGHLKVAEACDYLANNLGLLEDERSWEEKVAEYAMMKEALEGEGSKLTTGIAPGAANALPTSSANPKPAPVEPRSLGEATRANQVPMSTALAKVRANDPATALETNMGKLAAFGDRKKRNRILADADAPTGAKKELLSRIRAGKKQGGLWGKGVGGGAGALVGLAGADTLADSMQLTGAKGLGLRAAGAALGGGVGAFAGHFPGKHIGGRYAQEDALQDYQASNGFPGRSDPSTMDRLFGERGYHGKKKVHSADRKKTSAFDRVLTKLSEDRINPAKIGAAGAPELQSAPGVSNVLSQGLMAGQGGGASGEGRSLISSIEAAINYTKKDAVTSRVKREMGGLLVEPAMSARTDKTLHKLLDNTPKAGVKLAAAKEALQHFADASPENAQRVQMLVKAAAEGVPVAAEGQQAMEAVAPQQPAAPAVAPMQPGASMDGGAMPSNEAMMAAQQGVTPEDVAKAEQMLAVQQGSAQGAQMAMAEVGGTEAVVPPGQAPQPAAPAAQGVQ